MLDPSLPLTLEERDEWGDPLADADAWSSMREWSPYEYDDGDSNPPPLAPCWHR